MINVANNSELLCNIVQISIFFRFFLHRPKWVMLKKARSLFRNALSATQLKKMESTNQDQIFGVYLASDQDKLQDFLTQMQTRTKVKLTGDMDEVQC